MTEEMKIIGSKAKAASRVLLNMGSLNKKEMLYKMAEFLKNEADYIIEENKKDLQNAEKNGMKPSMIDRLMLDNKRINSMADAVIAVANEKDPVGIVLEGETLENGLQVRKITVPLGVIGIIYEARPNVTSDAAALCLRSGNACILRGGKEAINSNVAIVKVLRNALGSIKINPDCIQLITDTSRNSATELMTMTEYLDVLIPRGGAGLIKSVKENSRVPVIETGVGNCHVYIDESADLNMAANIVFNAKTSRPSVCNACETLLVNEKIAEKALPLIKEKLDVKKVEIRGCEKTQAIIPCKEASDLDYETEFLDYIIAVKVVKDTDEAIEHIAKYSTHHSECIVTESIENMEKFTSKVDSAAVYVNASTRFTDGGELGLGAEIGISTQKLHARGPMGLKHLVSYKYIITGKGQVR
ncbi:MAG: glutamate-5-semialdehyde dehydrogenase [Ruminococcaceae bacterium]|nr:glutamate-5-semialdehyde dehydrogenase [Oscillospiraceae bacterium]